MRFRSGICARVLRPAVPAVGAALFVVVLSGCRGQDAPVDFNAEIRPILNEKCVSCHGGVRRRSDLSLLFREDALQPAKSGKAAIVPGDPDASELIRLVSLQDEDDRMPKGDHPLAPQDVARLRRWVSDGAHWEPHWAYVAPVSPPLPPVENQSWERNPIDRFVLARLEDRGLEPSPEADCPVLVRRVTLDLLGLPPDADEVSRVCAGSAPGGAAIEPPSTLDARYSAYVDSLLASPRYGERWAAMWLDLARYADTQGYEKDGPRSIWRYRDWVIDAFNEDMPFDQFTVEQLAGDLLPDPSVEQVLATAFNRNTMTNTEGGTDDEEHRVAAVIDRVNTTFEVWQGTSAGCAQCHGHPYDPLRHEEYYELFAFFNNTADWDQPDDGPVLREFESGRVEDSREILNAIARVEAEMRSRAGEPEIEAARAEWETQLDDPLVVGLVLNTWQNELLRVVAIDPPDRTPAQHEYSRRIFVETRPEFDDLRKRRSELYRSLAELEPTSTPVMKSLPPDVRRATHVFERGNFLLPAQSVIPDVPAFLPPLADEAAADTGALPRTRLTLARWLVAAENPLTARVTVNRFWEQLFGLGIVETLEDFGTQGSPPTHKNLLDWLSVEFGGTMNWSVKELLRTIVTSSTYRQSSRVTPESLDRDPRNLLLARGPRFRLSAEQVRDQALAVGGLLSDRLGGPSVMPPQPEGIWKNPYSNLKWETAVGDDRYRRALYTYWRRSAPYPSMVTFDSPSREFCVSRRIRTNTPLQALVTLNDPAFVEAAEGLASRMRASPATDSRGRVREGYRIAMGYDPDPVKLDALVSLHDDVATASAGDPEREALLVVANAIMNTDEFLTKE